MVAGFVLCAIGVYLVAGPGWACLASGSVLFVAGGLDRVRR
jgi:hypothetical protein